MSSKEESKDPSSAHKQPSPDAAGSGSGSGSSPPTTAETEEAKGADADYTFAQALQTIMNLTTVFNFTYEQAEDAVNNVGPDVTLAYNYILDQGGEDKGGPIVPKSDCPHINTACHVINNVEEFNFNFKSDSVCRYFADEETSCLVHKRKPKRKCEVVDGKCPDGENWICLECGAVRCSRYINGHAKDHWENTKAAEKNRAVDNNENDIVDNDKGNQHNTDDTEATGHCIALSLEDLSIWCYECNAYLNNPELARLVQKFEKLKFDDEDGDGGGEKHSKDSKDGQDSNKVEEGSPGNVSSNDSDGQNKYDESNGKESKSTNTENIEKDGEMESCNEMDSPESELESESSASEQDERGEFVKKRYSFPVETPDPDPHPYLPKSLKDLANFIKSDDCQSIIILAGAGMSRSSGIPDFRSAGGLYDSLQVDRLTATESQRELIRSDPSAVFDKHLFLENPLPCLECKRPFILGTKERKWKTTIAHRFIELLHVKTEKLTRLYQQNIDGLEMQCTKLPSELVVPVHGSMDRVCCELQDCQAEYDFDLFCEKIQTNIKDISGVDDLAPSISTPIKCGICSNNTVKPTVVLFHSPLPEIFFRNSVLDLPSTDLIFIIGTSLAVGPANSLVYRVPDECLRVVVNNEPVGFRLGIDYSEDATRDYFLRGSCDEMLLDLIEELDWIDDLQDIMHELSDSSKELLTNYLESRGNTNEESG